MAQKQLDVVSLEEFSSVQWEPNQVTCQLQERFSLVVKRYQNEVYVLLRSGSKFIKLPCDMFETICNAQLSIAYLARYLEEYTGGHEIKLDCLCCYCGLRFRSEVECQQHEEKEHITETEECCFHANLMECDQCEKCGPDFRASMLDI